MWASRLLVGLVAFLANTSAVAAQGLSASLSLQVQATVLGQATWYRKGGDFDCGFFRPARRDKSMGTRQLTRNLDITLGPELPPKVEDQVVLAQEWMGHTFVARRTAVSLELAPKDAGDRFIMTLTDSLNQGRESFDNDGKCGHTAGSIRLSSDRIRGKLRLSVVPEGPARAVAVSFKRRAGLFQRVVTDGVLHPAAGSRADALVLWVKAGESPTLTFEFDEAYGGLSSGASGTVLELEVRSLGTTTPSLATLSSTLRALPHRRGGTPPTAAQILDAIDVLLGAVNLDSATRTIVADTPWEQLFALTDELFRFEVWPLPGTVEITRDLKVAARLFGFSLGKTLLKDLLTFCGPTTVSLPDGTTLDSSRALVVDGFLRLVASLLAEYPTATAPVEAEADLKAYYANHPRGFETAVEAISRAISVSEATTLDHLLTEVRDTLSRAATQERLVRAGLEASSTPAAMVSKTMLVDTAKSRQLAIAAVNKARQVVSVDSRSVDSYAIRLFTTDAHLVRLVLGDVDPYLVSVRDAYLQDGELAAEFDQIDECIKSGG